MTQVKYSLTGLFAFTEYYEFDALFKKCMEGIGDPVKRARPIKKWLKKHPNVHFEIKEVQS